MSEPRENAEQIEYWNATAGPKWVELQRQLDEQLEPYGAATLEAAAPRVGAAAIDVGCGCGATTIALGRRVSRSGSVLGVDISAVMLERARAQAAEAGLDHVRFECADAQVHPFQRASADLVYSRFGIMFFENPRKAFANLRGALRGDGRLSFICWQSPAENPWMSVPTLTVMQYVPLDLPPDPNAPGPFAFADPARVRSILEDAGFADIRTEALRREIVVGGTGGLGTALDFILRMCPASRALAAADARTRQAAADAVRAALAPYQSGDGVRMASAAWIVTAHNRGPAA
jgi:SAM-dependent methyltransferase